MILALLTIHLLSGNAPPNAVELEQPGVDYRVAAAGATAAPWLTANGWRFLRKADDSFVSRAAGTALPLAMVEAFAWHGNVWFEVESADRPKFDEMLAFLESIPSFPALPRAQIAVEEDGTGETGEVLKLLRRRNLMAATHVQAPELTVKPEKNSASNPAAFAAKVRQQLGDGRRLFRIYGTDVVLGQLEGDASHTRVHLVNYSNRDVSGARIRVLGAFTGARIVAFGQPDLMVKDMTVTEGGTEFTVPTLSRYAVVDLTAEPVLVSKHIASDFELTASPAAPQWRGTAPVATTQNAMLPATEIRSRWSEKNLYLLFTCPYDSLNLKPNPAIGLETPKLWNWDVAEAFIGFDAEHIERYREFQVSPQGERVDLEIDRAHPKPDGGAGWNSGFTVKAQIDAARKVWYGEMKIPMSAFGGKPIRIGLFRLQNKQQIAWQPTGKPSFHVPEAFGKLRLDP